jgi:hypothetical protein
MSKVVSTHGWVRYRKHGCRCNRCRDGHANRFFAENKKRAARLTVDPGLAPHGCVSTYSNYGCRCRPCRGAKSEENHAQYRARRARAGVS